MNAKPMVLTAEGLKIMTDELDYLIIVNDTPKEIIETYMEAIGRAPMMPEYAMGFWQSKLRYRTQDELMTVARKYRELNFPYVAN